MKQLVDPITSSLTETDVSIGRSHPVFGEKKHKTKKKHATITIIHFKLFRTSAPLPMRGPR